MVRVVGKERALGAGEGGWELQQRHEMLLKDNKEISTTNVEVFITLAGFDFW